VIEMMYASLTDEVAIIKLHSHLFDQSYRKWTHNA
jgi:hypothetical protein